MQRKPSRSDWKYSSVPSGDHAPSRSIADPSVIGTQSFCCATGAVPIGAANNCLRTGSMIVWNTIQRSSLVSRRSAAGFWSVGSTTVLAPVPGSRMIQLCVPGDAYRSFLLSENQYRLLLGETQSLQTFSGLAPRTP